MALTHQALELALATALAMVGYATLDEMHHFFIACFAVLAVAVVLLVIRAVRKEPTRDDKCTEDHLMRATPTGVSIAAGLVGLVVFGLTVFTKRDEIEKGVLQGYHAVRDFDPEMMYRAHKLRVKEEQVRQRLRGDETLRRATDDINKMVERRRLAKEAAAGRPSLRERFQNQRNRLVAGIFGNPPVERLDRTATAPAYIERQEAQELNEVDELLGDVIDEHLDDGGAGRSPRLGNPEADEPSGLRRVLSAAPENYEAPPFSEPDYLPGMTQAEATKKLSEIFALNDSRRMQDIPALLTDYAGRYEELIDELKQQYANSARVEQYRDEDGGLIQPPPPDDESP
jgi:hypothetical protein